MRSIVRRIAETAGLDSGLAVRTFDICAGAIENTVWPQMAWRFSRLTADGCPLEFVFSTNDNALRYTIEAAGPETPMHQRLDAACALLERLSATSSACPPNLVDEWRTIQASAALRWGCWIGVRQDRSGQRFKLYIETPLKPAPQRKAVAAISPPSEEATASCGARGRVQNLVMIGYEPVSGRVEHYFRKKPMAASELAVLSDKGPQILEDAFGMPIDTALQFFSPGYSVAAGQIAFFLRCGWMGGAAAVRRKLFARESNNALHCYREMLGSQRDNSLPDHGVVTVAPDGALRVGISGAALMSTS